MGWGFFLFVFFLMCYYGFWEAVLYMIVLPFIGALALCFLNSLKIYLQWRYSDEYNKEDKQKMIDMLFKFW